MANGDTALLDPRPTPGAPGLTPGATTALANPPAPSDALATDAEDRKLAREMLQQYKEAGEQQQTIYAAKEKTLAPQYAAMEKQLKAYGDIGERALARYEASQQDIPQYQQPDMRGDAQNWMMIAATLGAISGGLSRGYTTAGLNAMTGILTGFNKGSLTLIEQNYQKWQANADRAVQINAQAQREYLMVMQNAKMSLDQRANMIEMIANKYQDQIMASEAHQKNLTGMANFLTHQMTATERFLLEQQKLQVHHDDNLSKLKMQAAQNGLTIDDEGNIKLDETPGSVNYERAKAIAEYRQAPVTGTRGGATMLMGLVQKINPSYDATKWTGNNAYARTAGSYGARVESATNEVGYFIPQALSASNGLPRGKWVPVNTVVNDARAGKSDPRYYDFATANISLINAYARAVNPSGVPRIQDKEHIEKLLSTATSPQAYQAVLKRIAKEVRASHAAIAMTRGENDQSADMKNNIFKMDDAQLDQWIDANGVNTEGTSRLRVNVGTGEVTLGGGVGEFPGFSIAPTPVAPPTAAQ